MLPSPGGHRSALRPEPCSASRGLWFFPPPLPRPEPGRDERAQGLTSSLSRAAPPVSRVREGSPSLAHRQGCTCDCPHPAAIDYSEGALLEARRLLRATAAFVEDARAYVRGQLAGGPVQEDVLWERWVHSEGPEA